MLTLLHLYNTTFARKNQQVLLKKQIADIIDPNTTPFYLLKNRANHNIPYFNVLVLILYRPFSSCSAHNHIVNCIKEFLITRRSLVQVLPPQPKNSDAPQGCLNFFISEMHCTDSLRVFDTASYARWAIFATAACGGCREQKSAKRSKPTATNRSARRFWAPREARSDNPEVVGSSPSPATKLKPLRYGICRSKRFLLLLQILRFGAHLAHKIFSDNRKYNDCNMTIHQSF